MQPESPATKTACTTEPRQGLPSILPALALVVIVVLGARSLLSGPSSAAPPRDPDPPSQAQRFGTDALKGDPAAQVGVIVYSEFQCPFCAQFALTTFRRLDEAYIKTGRVAFAFRHFPLEAIHPAAMQAAKGAACADQQGRFWEMHDRLFVLQASLTDDMLAKAAADLGLDLPRWRACGDGPAGEKIRSDIAQATALGLSKTPSFLIGTLRAGSLDVRRVIVGARPFEEFAAVLDPLLSASPTAKTAAGR